MCRRYGNEEYFIILWIVYSQWYIVDKRIRLNKNAWVKIEEISNVGEASHTVSCEI